jgi:hypothetical protein
VPARSRTRPAAGLLAACSLAAVVLALAPLRAGAGAAAAESFAPRSVAADLPATAAPPEVTVGAGEAPGVEVVHWDANAGESGPGVVDLYDADAPDPLATAPLATVPTAPGSSGVVVPPLTAGIRYEAMVTVTGGGPVRRLGPSAPFGAGPVAASLVSPAPSPCLGAGFGPGAVSVDGFAGVQGSYCLPPPFVGGTGAFCIDHGLDYPRSAYRWVATSAGPGDPLTNQYGRTVDPRDVERLAWVVATWGSTPDPARAVAVGVIAHAVMGDYPGLTVADLAGGALTVTGGQPAATVADVRSMWASSGAAGPYRVTVTSGPGIPTVGSPLTVTVTVTGSGGAPESGAAVSLGASTGIAPAAGGITGADGTVTLPVTPTSPDIDVVATVTTPLPADTLTLWTPQAPPVPVQRVVTAGAPLHPSGSVSVSVTRPATATLRKVSTDPAVTVGAGFSFAVAVDDAGAWVPVATRATAADGSMASLTGLLPGIYRVTETATPPAFLPGGPWQFSLTAGQQATWTLADAPAPQPLAVAKTGDDPALPVAGATFWVDDVAPGGIKTSVGSVTTGPSGTTDTLQVEPGTYLISETTPPPGYAPANPVQVTVPPVAAGGPVTQVVSVTDHALPGTLEVVKTDVATGADLPGAVVSLGRIGPDGVVTPLPAVTTGAGPTDVTGLAPGTYRLAEVSPPAGYQPDTTPQTVDLLPGQVLAVVFPDRPLPPPTTAPPTSTPSTTAPPTTAPPTTAPPTSTPSPSTPPTTATAPATTVSTAASIVTVPSPTAPPTTAATSTTTTSTTTTVPLAVPVAVTASPAGLAYTGLPLWRWLLAAAGCAGIGTGLTLWARRPGPWSDLR